MTNDKSGERNKRGEMTKRIGLRCYLRRNGRASLERKKQRKGKKHVEKELENLIWGTE